MTTPKKDNDDYILSYLILRQLIGILGLCLPFGLLLGNKLLGSTVWLQPSISHFYYGYMHIAFVGVLCVLGALFITYKGKSKIENKISNCSGVFAFLVALFPTKYCGFIGNNYITTSVWKDWFNYIHFGSATLLFICFAFFCLKIFQESDEGIAEAKFDYKKKRRNKIYKTCGWGIIASIAMIGGATLYENIYNPTTFTTYATFIFETTALLFFGNSWLLKGSLNWKNRNNSILSKLVKPVR